MQFSQENRLRKNSDFTFVRQNAIKADCSAFILYMKHVDDSSRIAIVASRKVGNAIRRNYAKRIFREFFRGYFDSCDEKIAMIVYLRRGYHRFDFEKLKSKFNTALDNFKNS
ncbi:MAG: ribonuclease P protein component [Opitutales bacterium]